MRVLRPTPQGAEPVAYLTPEDLLRGEAEQITEEQFPDRIAVGQTQLPLSYRFAPGDEDDDCDASTLSTRWSVSVQHLGCGLLREL